VKGIAFSKLLHIFTHYNSLNERLIIVSLLYCKVWLDLVLTEFATLDSEDQRRKTSMQIMGVGWIFSRVSQKIFQKGAATLN